MSDAYATFRIEFEADLSGVQASMGQGLSYGRVYGQSVGDGFSEGFAQSVRSGFGSLGQSVGSNLVLFRSLRSQLGGIANDLSDAFGMKTSAYIEYFRRQLTGLTGDAGKANTMIEQLTRLASTTNYGNQDIFQMTTQLIGSGTNPDNAVEETQNIIDAAASSGTRNISEFKRLATALMNIRLNPDDTVYKQQAMRALRASPNLIKQAQNVLGGDDTEATFQKVFSMTGKEFSDMFQKIGAANKGRAEREGMADPLVASENLTEAFQNAQAATGRLINTTLMPLLSVGGRTIDFFAQMNAAGKGIPGLALGLGALTMTYRVYQSTIGRTTTSLNSLSLAAEGAVMYLRRLGINPGGAVGEVAAAEQVATAASRTAFLRSPVFWGNGAMLAGGAVSMMAPNDPKAQTAALYLTAVGAGVSAGASIGKFFGPAGAGIGGFFGGMFGLGTAVATHWHQAHQQDKADKAADKLEKAADKLDRAAGQIADASAQGYGGGKRLRSIQADIEAGYALFGPTRLGGI